MFKYLVVNEYNFYVYFRVYFVFYDLNDLGKFMILLVN